MRYIINTSLISLGEYEALLRNQTLLPGRRILQERLSERFAALSSAGICNVSQLVKALSTPQKLAGIAEATGLTTEYLTILRREAGSLEQKPIPLADIPDANRAIIDMLSEKGIRSSRDYFERAFGTNAELDALCDLARVNGIGAVAARVFYEAGYHSARDVAGAKAEEMLSRIDAINAKKQYYRARLTVKDMQFCIDFARLLLQYT